MDGGGGGGGPGSLLVKESRRPSLSPLERRELRISSPCLCSSFQCGLAGRSRRPGARTTWVHAQARQLVESCPELVEGMAEIEFSVLSRSCLRQRVPDEEALGREVQALVRERNAAQPGLPHVQALHRVITLAVDPLGPRHRPGMRGDRTGAMSFSTFSPTSCTPRHGGATPAVGEGEPAAPAADWTNPAPGA